MSIVKCTKNDECTKINVALCCTNAELVSLGTPTEDDLAKFTLWSTFTGLTK